MVSVAELPVRQNEHFFHSLFFLLKISTNANTPDCKPSTVRHQELFFLFFFCGEKLKKNHVKMTMTRHINYLPNGVFLIKK